MILYFSDDYAKNVMGTKQSIFEEVRSRGNKMLFVQKSEIQNILPMIDRHNPSQIWLAHSSLVIPSQIKDKIKIPVIGFGFSDPYYFTTERLKSYDAYVTNHHDTMLKYKNIMPLFYNPTACDFRFHKSLDLKKTIDVSIIGLGKHPRFQNGKERIDIFNRLVTETKHKIEAYGKHWNGAKKPTHSFVEGEAFLNVINSSKIGLDLQDDWSPLAHRMFEYSACGVPVITRNRPEVFMHFEKNKEILTYDDYKDLKETINYYLNRENELIDIGFAAKKRCEKEHDIKYRVEKLLKFVKIED